MVSRRLLATVEVMSDPKLVEKIRQGEREIKAVQRGEIRFSLATKGYAEALEHVIRFEADA